MATTLEDVLAEVRPVGEWFTDAGFSLYLVGGIVRDLLLDAPTDDLDFDLTTDATPEQIKSIVSPLSTALWSQGERFGTIGCRINDRPIEITTHRAESYGSDSRKPEVVFGSDITVDLSRRDFTVNAMAIQLPDGELVDPFHGRTALDSRMLVTPIDPEVSFGDDPLRILRAARFVARYELVPVEGLMAAATALIGRLAIVSVERIREEYDKLLAARLPSSGLHFLNTVGALPHLFAHFPPSQVSELASQLDASPTDVSLRRTLTFSHVPTEDRSAQLSLLKYSNHERRSMLAVLDGFDQLEQQSAWTDADVRRLVDRVGFAQVPELFAVAQLCSVSGVTTLQERFDQLDRAEDLSDLEPALSGGAIIERLGLAPGPEVGALVAQLRDRRLNHGPATADEELEWLRDVAAN